MMTDTQKVPRDANFCMCVTTCMGILLEGHLESSMDGKDC